MVPRDQYHQRATIFFRSIARNTRLVTSNYVLSEAFTWLRDHNALDAETKLRDSVEAAERVGLLDIEWVTRPIHDEAMDTFAQYADMALSIADCTSFGICKARRVDYAFAFDADYLVMGISLLPGLDP